MYHTHYPGCPCLSCVGEVCRNTDYYGATDPNGNACDYYDNHPVDCGAELREGGCMDELRRLRHEVAEVRG